MEDLLRPRIRPADAEAARAKFELWCERNGKPVRLHEHALDCDVYRVDTMDSVLLRAMKQSGFNVDWLQDSMQRNLLYLSAGESSVPVAMGCRPQARRTKLLPGTHCLVLLGVTAVAAWLVVSTSS